MASDRHMATARRLARKHYDPQQGGYTSLSKGIAKALANAERDGMKRAAEIAESFADEKDVMALHACTDSQVASYREGERTAKQIVAAILPNFGEDSD